MGDIVYDAHSKETGTLIRRHVISVDYDWDEAEHIHDDLVWAWDIFWTGSANKSLCRITTYTEEGLKLILSVGVLQLQKK